jgi:3-oxoadipate enol-lactonase
MPITKVNGININYSDKGEGEPLVMIMGLGIDQKGWMRQVSAFKKKYRVITFDNRGIGKSDKPEGLYTPKLLAEDTIRLMDFLKIQKAHIIGDSMGGLVAQEIAFNYPDRVIKLILASTYAYQDNETNGITSNMLAVQELPVRTAFPRFIDAIYNKWFYKLLFATLLKLQAKGMKKPEIAGLTGQLNCNKGYNSIDRLPLIKTPTLVITGTGDKIIRPGSSDTLSQKIPGARLVKIDGGSHAIYLEMSKEFNKAILDFLKSN